MKLLLPLFLFGLALKNFKSWTSMFLEAFGFQLVVILLLLVNLSLGGLLFFNFHQDQRLTQSLDQANTKVSQQRAFWQKLSAQVPGHKDVIEAQKTLTRFSSQ